MSGSGSDEWCLNEATMEDQAKKSMTKLLSWGRKVYIPQFSTIRVCGFALGHAARREQEKEVLRQSGLASLGKTERQVAEEAYELLKCYPSLASFKYRNYFGTELYPLWYFVLSGFPLDVVRSVFLMFPAALSAPLKEIHDTTYRIRDQCGTADTNINPQRYFLLQAVCKPGSVVDDDVIIFVAKKHPEGRLAGSSKHPSASSQMSKQPFIEKALSGASLASMEVLKALVPDDCWSLHFISALFSRGYGNKILNHAVDMLLAHGRVSKQNMVYRGGINEQNSRMVLQSNSARPNGAALLLDYQRALVLERLICTPGDHTHHPPGWTPVVREFVVGGINWTEEGLNHTLACLRASNNIERLTLTIDQVSNDGTMMLLEELFAHNTSVSDLTLKVQNTHLGSIVRGLGRAESQMLNKLTLLWMDIPDLSILEPFLMTVSSPLQVVLQGVNTGGRWNLDSSMPHCVSLEMSCRCKLQPHLLAETLNKLPKAKKPTELEILFAFGRLSGKDGQADLTKQLLRIINESHLEKLFIMGSPASYKVDVTSLVLALKQENTLRFVEFRVSDIGQDEEVRLAKDLLSLVKANDTLEQLIVSNNDTKMDYTGFSKHPGEFRTRNHPKCEHIYDDVLAEQITHYMRLNKFGRKRVRNEATTCEDFILLLDAARQKMEHEEMASNYQHSLFGKKRLMYDHLAYFNVVFGLLIEFEPNKWISGRSREVNRTAAEVVGVASGERLTSSGSQANAANKWSVFLCNMPPC